MYRLVKFTSKGHKQENLWKEMRFYILGGPTESRMPVLWVHCGGQCGEHILCRDGVWDTWNVMKPFSSCFQVHPKCSLSTLRVVEQGKVGHSWGREQGPSFIVTSSLELLNVKTGPSFKLSCQMFLFCFRTDNTNLDGSCTSPKQEIKNDGTAGYFCLDEI